MGSLQRGSDLHSQLKHLLDWQGPDVHVLLQRPAFEQLHDEELPPVVLPHIVDRAPAANYKLGKRKRSASPPGEVTRGGAGGGSGCGGSSLSSREDRTGKVFLCRESRRGRRG